MLPSVMLMMGAGTAAAVVVVQLEGIIIAKTRL